MRFALYKKCDLAYGCHLYAALGLASLILVEGLYALGLLDFASMQGLGMVIGIPLAFGAIIAVPLGAVMSFSLYRIWQHELGLLILMVLFGFVVRAFVLDEQKPGGNYWFYYATALYLLGTLFFSLRWFFVRRKWEVSR